MVKPATGIICLFLSVLNKDKVNLIINSEGYPIMMNKFFDTIFSMKFAGALLLVIAAAIGTATFIENDFGTTAAKVMVYNSKWFELLLLITTISLIGSVFKYKLYQRKRFSVLFFHLSFVLIILGAAITRYIGYEGTLKIREGKSSNELISMESYVQIWIDHEDRSTYHSEEKLFSVFKKNRFSEDFDLNGKRISIRLKEYIPNAAATIVEDPAGDPVISLVTVGSQGGRQTAFIKSGETFVKDSIHMSFQAEDKRENSVLISFIDNQFIFTAPYDVILFSMMENRTDTLTAGLSYTLEHMKLYTFNGIQVVFRSLFPNAITKLVTASGGNNSSGLNAATFDVEYDGSKTEISALGGKGFLGEKASAELNGVNISIAYGSKIIKLPFSLYLRDFQLERYPGSQSPSSFASEVTVVDPGKDLEMEYKIFMNNVLNHGGYRFFQSSYDMDELGTILSVNHDFWGTLVTYAGYAVLTAGLFFNFFSRRSRFQMLAKASRNISKTGPKSLTVGLIALFFLSGVQTMGQEQGQGHVQDHDHDHNVFTNQFSIDKQHAASFGELLVQDRDGRMMPMNTLSSEVLRKIYRKEKYLGLNSDQVFLGMTTNPGLWQSIPMIRVSDKEVKTFIGISGKYASFNDFIDRNQGAYKLSSYVEIAYNKKPAERNRFDKDIIKVDERINIAYMVYTGEFLTLFPKPSDPDNKWYTAIMADHIFDSVDAGFVNNILPLYYEAINTAILSGEWEPADEYLGFIKTFQSKYGSEVLPSAFRTKLEILYNKFNLFKRLFPFYAFTGLIMLILLFTSLLSSRFRFTMIIRIITIFILLGFIFHTIGLASRWYIAGHAPWSNGYETMIFISWGIVLSGLIFAAKSRITLATTAILASLTLMVANLSWMDPEITNLVPVLKSYWLVIHVAVITSSYSFLGIGALLGFLNLLLINFQNRKNYNKLKGTIQELTNITEMNLIIGVFLITIGTFLGAVWANESWGRYWGWDPKETWALVTVLVYSFVVHMRLIPGLNGVFAFNFASLISFSTVLMTYFGVNYYLSGLHSYAKGDPVPVPSFVYYTIAIVAIVSIMGYINYNRNKKLSFEE